MMRLFIFALVALVLGAAFALFLADDPGYVRVTFHGWSVESTLGAVILALIALFVVVAGVLWLLRLVNPLKLFSPAAWQSLFARRSAVESSNKGFDLLMLGHWQQAYKLLVENAERVQNPVINYVAAALAAHERGDKLGRNFCLDRAEKRTSGDNYGIRAFRAWMQGRDGETEQSLALLLALKRLVPESPFILREIKDRYVRLTDWDGLADLLPVLEKHDVASEDELHALQRQVAHHRLAHAGAESVEALHLVWQDLSKPLKQDEALVTLYIQRLMAQGQDADASAQISRQLKHHWSDTLVAMLGYVRNGNPQQLLLLLEEALKDRPNNPTLLLTLGRVSLRNQLWGKAREYFEHALRMSTSGAMTAEISGELGRLLEHLGDTERSLACYQRAMQLMDRQLPDLPMPANTR